jgi:hypothetical protein
MGRHTPPANLRLGCVAVLLQRVNGFPGREPSKRWEQDAYPGHAAHILRMEFGQAALLGTLRA